MLLSDGSSDVEECNVTRLDEDQIQCIPPDAEDGTYVVQVGRIAKVFTNNIIITIQF